MDSVTERNFVMPDFTLLWSEYSFFILTFIVLIAIGIFYVLFAKWYQTKKKRSMYRELPVWHNSDTRLYSPNRPQRSLPMSPTPMIVGEIPIEWKEAFKNNILVTIGDMIDAQFANQANDDHLILNMTPPQSKMQVKQPIRVPGQIQPRQPETPQEGDKGGDISANTETTHRIIGVTPRSTNTGVTCILTPLHLRKAKLMFLWVRYPSQSTLKLYFPDIDFNEENMKQLEKWFSDFRTLYYNETAKVAQAAVAQGVNVPEDIDAWTKFFLCCRINYYYNRQNHVEIPSNFHFVVEETLKEVFKIIKNYTGSEQDWRVDQLTQMVTSFDETVPEIFKEADFLKKLE